MPKRLIEGLSMLARWPGRLHPRLGYARGVVHVPGAILAAIGIHVVAEAIAGLRHIVMGGPCREVRVVSQRGQAGEGAIGVEQCHEPIRVGRRHEVFGLEFRVWVDSPEAAIGPSWISYPYPQTPWLASQTHCFAVRSVHTRMKWSWRFG